MISHITGWQFPGMNMHNTRLYALFFLGSTLFLLRHFIILSTPTFILLVITLLISSIDKFSFFVFYNLSIAYLVFYLAYVPAGKIRLFNRLGDYSYGLYIYAFPVQQAVIALIDGISIVHTIVLSFAITLLLAIASWHLLEKPCLSLKK